MASEIVLQICAHLALLPKVDTCVSAMYIYYTVFLFEGINNKCRTLVIFTDLLEYHGRGQ